MKAYVYVSLKKSVLDPQGKTIHGALKKMGYRGVDDLRQGKYFEIALDDSVEPRRSSGRSGADCPRGADQSGDRGIPLYPRGITRHLAADRETGAPSFAHQISPAVTSNQLTFTIQSIPLSAFVSGSARYSDSF